MAKEYRADYQAEIDAAVAAKDYSMAAQLEQERNAKIRDTGSKQQQTNLYSRYLNGGSGAGAATGKTTAQSVLDRAVGIGGKATKNLGAYKDTSGNTTTYRPEFAGQTVQMGNQYVTYNAQGYPVKATGVQHAKNLGNAYTSQYMGLDQTKVSNAADLYRGLYTAAMKNPTTVRNSALNNAFGKRNIQYGGGLSLADYDELIKGAAARGNNVLAGYHEDSRNAMIADRGLDPNLQRSTYNGAWNYVDNGGGVGNIYAKALRDTAQTDQALGGGWYAGQGKGDPAEEYHYLNTDAPTTQEILAYARMKGYNTEDENETIPVGDLAREMMAGGYVSPANAQRAQLLGNAVQGMMGRLGIAGDYTGAEALENAVSNMKSVGVGPYAAALAKAAEKSAASGISSAALSSPYSAALAGGGGYGMGGGRTNGGVSYGGSAYGGSLENQLMGIYGNGNDAALRQLRNLTDAQTRMATSALEAQKDDVNQSYADTARQMYINRENTKKNIDQQMAAQGITGGAAESTLLGIDTSYQEALRQNEQERISEINNLAQQIIQAQLTGDISYAQQALQMEQDRMDKQASMIQYMLGRQDDAAALAYSQQADKAKMLASAGDFSGYKALGYSDEEIAVLTKAYQVANTPKVVYRNTPTADNETTANNYNIIRTGVNELLAQGGNFYDVGEYLNGAVEKGYISEADKETMLKKTGYDSSHRNGAHY